MEYIFQNWSDLNLIDRAWFLGGAWLLLLFMGIYLFRIIRSLTGKNRSPSGEGASTQVVEDQSR